MFKKAVQRGRSERRGEAYSFRYVEPLSDARTKLAAFFNILLVEQDRWRSGTFPVVVAAGGWGLSPRHLLAPSGSVRRCSDVCRITLLDFGGGLLFLGPRRFLGGLWG